MDGDINPHTARNSNSSSSLMNCSDHHQLNIIPSDDHVNQSCCDGGGGGCEIDWVGLLSGSSLSNNFEMENKVGIMGDYEGNTHVVGGKEVGYGGGGKTNTNKGKMVMGKRSSSTSMPRIAFQTRSAEDVLDDGYRWRKYGQKAVKHSTHPRSYYRCTHHTCNVKKQIQRHSKDPAIVVTTYEGIHNHPSEKLMETLSPLLKQLQFLSGI